MFKTLTLSNGSSAIASSASILRANNKEKLKNRCIGLSLRSVQIFDQFGNVKQNLNLPDLSAQNCFSFSTEEVTGSEEKTSPTTSLQSNPMESSIYILPSGPPASVQPGIPKDGEESNTPEISIPVSSEHPVSNSLIPSPEDEGQDENTSESFPETSPSQMFEPLSSVPSLPKRLFPTPENEYGDPISNASPEFSTSPRTFLEVEEEFKSITTRSNTRIYFATELQLNGSNYNYSFTGKVRSSGVISLESIFSEISSISCKENTVIIKLENNM